ncbi:MAG: flagellar motor switch protein FliG [Magnetococcales bacterium]|nr:flagellar motor switch protein FliG [Magnetococcales bacterium]MEC8067406.1 flagellar motor switch protein FliG [Pseudomonadota bacterium]|tara:strand:+ start:7765 stop:8811 length:1047 start_codon:yes stop_codon:yes gene_type:complete
MSEDNNPNKGKSRSSRSPREIGARNAAILMLAVGEENATTIFSGMDDFEIRDISREMATLGKVTSEDVENVINEFTDAIGSGGAGLVGGWNATERYLMSFMDESRVRDLMDEMRGPAGRTMWEKLANVSEDILANYLKNEYPQTVAVIVSRIKPGHAAKVLAALPEELALEVIERILIMDNVSREVIESVEDSLKNEFMRNLAAKQKRDSHELMAEIFNNFDRSNEQKFMDLLDKRSHDDAERIRSLMFTFEDLKKTDDKGIQTILREVEKDLLPVALKGADDELLDMFMRNMSERAAKIMEEDMGAMGPVRVKDVDEAQNSVVMIAKRLAETGQIVLAEEGGADDFI